MANLKNVAVFGEALIDFIEQDTGLFKPCIGGSPFNVAVAFSRLSLNSVYVSPISTDPMGQRIADYAQQEGILTPLKDTSARNTSLALVAMNEAGQPDYELYRNGVADLDIDAKTIIANLPKELKVFHTGSLALVPAMKDTLLEVFAYLKANNIAISLDVNMRKCFASERDAYLASVRALMTQANFIKVSDEDIEALTGHAEYAEFCQSLLAHDNVRLVALTEGAKGATLITRQQRVFAPAVVPAQLKDTVGAGDTFFASLIAYLVHHNLIADAELGEDTLKKVNWFAAIAASINVSREGCNPPSIADVEAFAAVNHLVI